MLVIVHRPGSKAFYDDFVHVVVVGDINLYFEG